MRQLMGIALLAGLMSTAAWAEDEDLVPLVPKKPAAKPVAKPPAKPAAKPAAKPGAKPAAKPTAASQPDEDLVPLVRPKGKLVLKISKAGLERLQMTVDGQDVGPLKENTLQLEAGERVLVLKRPGFANVAKRVIIVSDKTTDLAVPFQAVAGVLSIKTDVPGAEVFVNGKFFKTTPFINAELPPGTVELAVRKAGYKEHTQTVKLVAGVEAPISLNLVPVAPVVKDVPVVTNVTPAYVEPPPDLVVKEAPPDQPITSKWYFWVGVGAVVAAAAVGTVVGVNNYNSQPPEKLTRDVVCKSLSDCICLNCTAVAPAFPLP